MSSSRSTAENLRKLLAGAGVLRVQSMFGEYGVYLDGVFCALICDDKMYLKPEESVILEMGTVKMGSPYKGAKPHICLGPPDKFKGDLVKLLQLTRDSVSGKISVEKKVKKKAVKKT